MFNYCPIHRDDCMGGDCMWWRDNDCVIATIGEGFREISASLDNIDADFEKILESGILANVIGTIETM